MARRNSTPNPTPAEQDPQVTTVEVTEAPAEAPKAEAPKVEKVIDLTAFKAAAEASVAEADSATGEVAVAGVESVVKEYRALDGLKAKNAAKAWLNEQMKAEMNSDNIQGARSYLQLHDSMSAGSSGGGSTKTPVDPTEAFVQGEATLRLAGELHQPGEGVAENHEEQVTAAVEAAREQATAYLAWLKSDAEDKGDEPETSAIAKNAVKLALGKAAKAGGKSGGGSTFTGERRDVAKHIVSAFEGVESGTFLTVAQIRSHKSEEYGDQLPSAGAISARLFPQGDGTKCTVEGITPGQSEGKGNKGATKN